MGALFPSPCSPSFSWGHGRKCRPFPGTQANLIQEILFSVRFSCILEERSSGLSLDAFPLTRQSMQSADSFYHAGLPSPLSLLHPRHPSALSLLLPLLSSPSSRSQVCQPLGIQILSPWLSKFTYSGSCCSSGALGLSASWSCCTGLGPSRHLSAICLSPVTSRGAWALGLSFGLSRQSLCINVHRTFFLRDSVEAVPGSTSPLPGWEWFLLAPLRVVSGVLISAPA